MEPGREHRDKERRYRDIDQAPWPRRTGERLDRHTTQALCTQTHIVLKIVTHIAPGSVSLAARGNAAQDWEHQSGSMPLRVVHLVVGDLPSGELRIGAAQVQIAIEPRKVAARNFQSDPMPRREYVAGRAERNRDLIDLPG